MKSHTKLRLLAAALCFGSLGVGLALAQVERSPLAGTQNVDNMTFYPRTTYPNGPFHAMGVIYGTTATVATATGTGEQILGTYSLPAGALDQAGRRIRIRAAFHCASNTNNKTMKLYFGGSVITTPTAASNNVNAVLELIVVKSGANTQIVTGSGLVNVTPVTPYVNASGSDTDTAAIVIKATGTDGTSSAADITLDDFQVEFMN